MISPGDRADVWVQWPVAAVMVENSDGDCEVPSADSQLTPPWLAPLVEIYDDVQLKEPSLVEICDTAACFLEHEVEKSNK